ncbi:transport permease protein [Planotetraspora silvatica]|uniref:Transport permease protein n=1 Tax=Planotetraspora silvatica TaxID=234614 RepID=A0A8J3UTE4_9ACTN|nr:ABC transporter permease [Planotetraspora silvatica]GII49452.1 transport permease protein [Planotetraspora silvatica]
MSGLFVHTWWMSHRRLKALLRNPGLVVMTLVQPAIWLFLFGGLFRKVAELPGFGAASYVDYLVPGVVVMSAVSSNMWSGMGVIDEIERGTLNRFLVSPVSRSAILNAGVIEQAVSTAIQSLIIILLGRLAGASYPGGVLGVVVLAVASILLGAIFSALSSTMGLLVRQRETIIGLSVFLLLPLTFLSSAFMAKSLMPSWIQNVAAFNPLNWSLDTARGALAADPDWQAVAVHGGWLLGLAALMIWLSTLSFRSYQKSI